jgi:threonine dehydrogenase-like Zn-dependent dehydrogenase
MRATVIYGGGDVCVEDVPDAELREPTNALVRVLDGTVQPGRVFDRAVGLEDVADGYRVMAEREALKVIVEP